MFNVVIALLVLIAVMTLFIVYLWAMVQEARADLARDCVRLPVPAALHCPQCEKQHIDRGYWRIRPHHKHRCEYCSHEWSPFPYPTVGVRR